MILHNEDKFIAHAPICHRCQKFNRGVCSIDSVSTNNHANAGYCPESHFIGAKPDGWDDLKGDISENHNSHATQSEPTLLNRIARAFGFDGRAIWNQIHALCFEPDLSAVRGKFHAIISALPCGDCKNGALKYEQENPIDISSPLGVARSTWNFQNHINVMLGKPQLAWNDAARLRGWDKLEAPELCC